MGDFLRALIEALTFLWPFRRIDEAERGGFYRFGRWVREVGPGVYPIVPWFMEVRGILMSTGIVTTGRCDITLDDGSTLSFDASARVRVVDVKLAQNAIDDFMESAQELLAATLADRLGSVDADRLSSQKRGRLFSDLGKWVDTEGRQFGIAFDTLTFTSFVRNVPTRRFLIDQKSPSSW